MDIVLNSRTRYSKGDDVSDVYPQLVDPAFWRLPLSDRMARFAELREIAPFLPATFVNPIADFEESFYVTTRYADVIEISRRPQEFCSGRGAVSIPDMPADAMEFFGSFISMDDPRHARQRGIVARSFTPKQLQGVLDSVETICAEVVDEMCEHGEVDLVEALSKPFPLLVICDMMGIPRSEFDTVLDATNIILGAGDPDVLDGRDPMSAMVWAGMQLTALVNELAELRRAEPADDLISALVNAEDDQETLARHEIAPFFILLAVAGNDTTRTAISHGMHLLSQNPDQRRRWQADLEAVTPTAVEEIVRVASPVTFMRRTATRTVTAVGARVPRRGQGRAALRRREPRSARVRRPRILRRAARPESPRGIRRPRSALLSRRAPRAP